MKKHSYRITAEYLSDPQDSDPKQPPLQFEVDNHDDIFKIISWLQQREEFDEQSAQAFGLGLKLFTKVMMENREAPLFATFIPHFKAFMMELKGKKQ